MFREKSRRKATIMIIHYGSFLIKSTKKEGFLLYIKANDALLIDFY